MGNSCRRAESRQDEEIELHQPELQRFRPMFEQYEQGIPLREVYQNRLTLRDSNNEELPQDVQQRIFDRADKNRDGRLDFREFVHLMTIDRPDLRAQTRFKRALLTTVSAVVPSHAMTKKHGGEKLVQSYMEHYSCCPPPLFIIIVSLIELIVFITYIVLRKNQDDPEIPDSLLASAPRESPLIYQPARRYEAWRFLTYMLIHDGYGHIFSNLIFQLLLGIPLEMVHKFWRVGIVYSLGVITGSLATSVTDPWTLLCGASGGVYALIGAHFAKIIMNWKDMSHDWMNESRWMSKALKIILSAPVQLAFFTLYMAVDTGVAIHSRFFSDEESRTAFVAHFAGFVGGMLMGIRVLKNFYVINWERVVGWVSFAIFIVFVVFAVCFNIFYTGYYPTADWRSCCPLPCAYYPNCKTRAA